MATRETATERMAREALTDAEEEQIDADPVLTPADVVAYRREREGET
jgi:hypothetical protein